MYIVWSLRPEKRRGGPVGGTPALFLRCRFSELESLWKSRGEFGARRRPFLSRRTNVPPPILSWNCFFSFHFPKLRICSHLCEERNFFVPKSGRNDDPNSAWRLGTDMAAFAGQTPPFSKEADAVWQFVFGSVSNFSSTVGVSYRSNSGCSALVFWGRQQPALGSGFSVNGEGGSAAAAALRGGSLLDRKNKNNNNNLKKKKEKKSFWTLLQCAMPSQGRKYCRFISYSTCFFVNYIFGDIFIMIIIIIVSAPC